MRVPMSAIGRTSAPITMTIERGRLRLFAKATGLADPAFSDVDAARALGHRDLPVPPTFLHAVEFEVPDPFEWVRALGIDMNVVLHGMQRFIYHRQAYAGDTVVASSVITDVYSKKGGALEFLDRRTEITSEGSPIATLEKTIIVRFPTTGSA